jgi:hypothetical protein
LYFASRTSELVALMAISTTLFLFIHTRELHTKLKAMEVKLQPEEILSGKCQTFTVLQQSSESLSRYVSHMMNHNGKYALSNAAHRIPDGLF